MQKCPTCPKCTGFYTATHRDNSRYKSSKQPILLNCGHTFCEICVVKLAGRDDKTTIPCPQCKVITNIPEDVPMFKALTPNYYIIGLLFCNQRTLLDQELSRLIPAGGSSTLKRFDRKYGEKLLCQECNLNKATCRCVKCDSYYCGLCFTKVHSGYNSLRHHQALEISDGTESVIIKEEVAPVCTDHDNRPIEYYCEDDLTPICSRCVIMGAHKGHSISSMEDKNKGVLAEMEPALQTANYVVKKLKKTEQSFNDFSPNFKAETTSVIEEIRAHFMSLHGTMQAREHHLIKEVYDKFNDSLLPVLYKKSDLHEEKRRLEAAIKAAQRILNNNNETVLNAKEILDHLLRARTIPCTAVKQNITDTTDSIKWNSGEPIESLINQHGSIEGSVSSRFSLQTIVDIPDTDDSDSHSSISHSSYTDTVNSSEDVIVEDERSDLEDDVQKKNKKTFLMEKQSYRAKYPGHCEQVYVTHIKSPAKFYCQKKTDQAKLNNLIKNMNIWCRSLAKESDIPAHVEEGDLVLAQYSADKKWYRARVLVVIPPKSSQDTTSNTITTSTSDRDTQSTTQDSETSSTIDYDNQNKTKNRKKKKDKLQTNEEQAEVLFFDYGNHEVIPISRTRHMQQRFLKVPQFMLECALHDIEPISDNGVWSKEAAQTFKKMIDGRVMYMNVIREINGILQVDLHKPAHNDIMDDSPVSLRESLIFLELACFSYNSEPIGVKPVLPASTNAGRNYTTPEPKTETDIFHVCVTSPETPHSFFVQPLGDECKYLTNMMAKMQDTYNVDSGDLYTVYCPVKGMICVALYTSDNQWYRARVINIPGRKLVDVQYVDYGYVDRIPYWNIRKILDTFLVLPPQAVYCRLCDIEPIDSKLGWSNAALDWWKDAVLFKQFHLKITGLPANVFDVVLTPLVEDYQPDNINTQLVQRGYAISTGVWSTGVQAIEPYKKCKTKNTGDDHAGNQTISNTPYVENSSTGPNTPRMVSPERTPVNSPLTSPSKQFRTNTHQPSSLTVPNSCSIPFSNTNSSSYISSSPYSTSTSPKAKPNVAQKLHVNVQKAAEQSSPSLTKDGSNTDTYLEVFVSAYVSPSNFHVQLAKKHDTALKDLMSQLQADCDRADLKGEKVWRKNEFCACKYSKDNMWYRAKILNVINKNLYQMQLVDYGHIDHCGFNDLRSLNNERRRKSCFAVKCHLASLYPAGSTDRHRWSITAREFMENQIKDKTCLIKKQGDIVSEDLGLPIDLIIEEEVPESALEPSRKIYYGLIEKIVDAGLAIPIKTSPSKKPKVDNPYYTYKKHPIPDNDTLIVEPTFVDYDCIIYTQICDEEEEMNEFTQMIHKKYSDVEPVVCDWKIGQACVALFELDECWYRASIVEMEDDKVQVLFVDYGNSSWQTYSSIRPPIPECLKKPSYSLQCYLHNVIPVSENGQWPVVTLEFIHNKLVGHQVTVHKQAVTEDEKLLVNINLTNGQDLTDLLLSKQCIQIIDDMTPAYNISTAVTKILQETTLKTVEPFSCGFKFPVAVTNIELPNLIYCQHKPLDANQGTEEYREEATRINNSLEELQRLSIDINMSAPQSHVWTTLPKPGNICSAQYSIDDYWYRALVITVDEESDLVKVLFVDYGNSEDVPKDRLRVLPKKLQKLPMQAMRCYIADLVPPDGQSSFSFECLKLLPQVLDGQEFLADVKSSEPLTIDLFLMKMEGEGLQLAHQFLVNARLAKFAPASNLLDMALNGGRSDDTPDVICEEEEVKEKLL
ncbi:hypothetical protein LOTGIDRAFT_229104 [Lottia gigantea]|uniref:RING finger protein 17 n=1 Tax=Lottia gigantea TaxID=225164 RepID=V4A7D6_LOTGI|nr:hypothetical protein LOTGIDRAFT_229104 [Lottia gigantea]ESO89211.1 hypothetical protein LOTGIDRAFT_229104 [Lottia gigantea]